MDYGCLTRGGLCICRKHLGWKGWMGWPKVGEGWSGLRVRLSWVQGQGLSWGWPERCMGWPGQHWPPHPPLVRHLQSICPQSFLQTQNTCSLCTDDICSFDIWTHYDHLIHLNPLFQSIEQLKKEGATWGKKSRWANIKSVFGSPFSLKWFSPFHTPNMHMGKLEPYQYCV